MDNSEKLKTCKKCAHKISDLQRGILCGLTNEKPVFAENCVDFELNKTEKEKQIGQKIANNNIGESNSGKASGWITTIFGALGYVITKYAIFEGHHSFLTGVLTFVIGAGIGYLFMAMFSRN